MKEQLVELTGLSLRVIRVWFQNKRCKDKKKSVTISKQKSVVRIFSYFGISLNEENFSPFVKKNKFYVADENFFFTEIFFFFSLTLQHRNIRHHRQPKRASFQTTNGFRLINILIATTITKIQII